MSAFQEEVRYNRERLWRDVVFEQLRMVGFDNKPKSTEDSIKVADDVLKAYDKQFADKTEK